MKTIAKLALGGILLAGAAGTAVAPAEAGLAIGVNVGVPGVNVAYYGPNPCARPFAFRPAYCYPVYNQPIFFGGGFYREPVYFRYEGGARYFWIHNGWVRDRVAFHAGFRR